MGNAFQNFLRTPREHLLGACPRAGLRGHRDQQDAIPCLWRGGKATSQPSHGGRRFPPQETGLRLRVDRARPAKHSTWAGGLTGGQGTPGLGGERQLTKDEHAAPVDHG